MLRCSAALSLSFALVLAQEPPTKPAPGNVPTAPAPEVPSPTKPGLVPEGAAGLDAMQLARAMTATMELSTPGPHHERLTALEGAYEVDMTLMPPGIEPQQFAGEARAMSVLSKRYLLVNLRVRLAGVVLEGLYIFGFDNLRGLYTASWRDSMSTWAVDCAGPVPEEAGERVPMNGTMVDAASPTGRPFQLVLQFTERGFDLVVVDRVKDAQVEVVRQRFLRKKDEGEGAVQPPRDK
ncbi:MAG: DUF1579 family protein [Planctomycetota bacterium]